MRDIREKGLIAMTLDVSELFEDYEKFKRQQDRLLIRRLYEMSENSSEGQKSSSMVS